MAKKALRKLTSAKLDKSEINGIIDALGKETDYAAAITGAALLEAELESLLAGKLKTRTEEFMSRVFSNRGPMADFHSKILIAEGFGYITSPMAAEISAIKDIRNAFAHSKKPLTFDNPVVTSELRAMRMGKAIRHRSDDQVDMSNRAWFLLTIRILLIMFDEFAASDLPADQVLDRMLAEPVT